MKRRGVAFLSLALLLGSLLAGCEPESGDGRKPAQTKPRVDAGQAKPKGGDNGGNAQPAPVQGDPGAHNTQPGMVGLFVHWESENKITPVCEWSRNGVSQPCANIASQHDDDSPGYYGFWEHEESAIAGTTYAVNAQGTGAIKVITCEIAWKGTIYPGVKQGSRCGASLTLP